MNDSKKYDVFISFSKKQRKLAQRFYDKLTAAGKTAFFFVESQNPGDNYKQRINDALHNSEKFLLICTVDSAASPQVRKECEIFNTLFKNTLGTENERRIFIFEGQDFESSYVPDIDDWDKIHRCNNFNKQIKALGVTKEKPKFLWWWIVGLSVLVAVVGGIYLLLPKNIQEDCNNIPPILEEKSALVQESKDSLINLNNYVNSERFGYEQLVWKREKDGTLGNMRSCDRESSGKYIVSVAGCKFDTLVLQIIPKEVPPNTIKIEPPTNDADKKEQEEFQRKFNEYLYKENFQEAEKFLRKIKNNGNLKDEYEKALKTYIDYKFDISKEEKFGNYIITRNKNGLWGVRDWYGNVKIECIYHNPRKPIPENGIVTFITEQEDEIRYNEKLKKLN